MGVELADDGRSAAEIADTLETRAPDMRMYVALETLEYLKKGGRISGAQAAIGTLLSVKPIICGQARRRSRRPTGSGRARRRASGSSSSSPSGRSSGWRSCTRVAPTSRRSATRCCPGSPGLDPAQVTIELVGASVGPHLGPGCVGAADHVPPELRSGGRRRPAKRWRTLR